MTKAIVVLSGGADSTICLYAAKGPGVEVHAITFDYGQRHAIELESAAKIAKMAGVASHEFVKLGDHILKSTSPLVSANVLEQYKDAHSLPGGLEKTFVPMRNQLFLTLAMNRAVAIGAPIVVTGVCQADSGGYPDCRQSFINYVAKASNWGTFDYPYDRLDRLSILTPLMNLTKAESVLWALTLKGCYGALAFSHTAYDGQYPPIGHDHATLLRAKGFEDAEVPDPLILRAVREGKMQYPNTGNYAPHLIAAYEEHMLEDWGSQNV